MWRNAEEMWEKLFSFPVVLFPAQRHAAPERHLAVAVFDL